MMPGWRRRQAIFDIRIERGEEGPAQHLVMLEKAGPQEPDCDFRI
jgi:hypothetical protein